MSLKITRPNTKNFDQPLTTDYSNQFANFLAEHGLEPDPKKGLVADGSIGRAYINVGGQRKLVGWYQLWLDQASPFGRLGDYRVSADQPTAVWKPENRKRQVMTKAEKEEIAKLQKQAEVKQQKKYSKAAKKAQALWESALPCEKHPYLEKKQVLSYGLKIDEHGNLVIPLYDKQLTIVGLQFIDPDGNKKFLTGSKKASSFFMLGKEILKTSNIINYAEGYATAASIYADLSQPVIVAFDAYNLQPVAEVMFEFFADKKHVFIADNDDSKTGEKEASKACQYIKKQKGLAEVLMPESKGDYNDHKNELTTDTALNGELLPALNKLDLPDEIDFQRSANGRFLNTKDNIAGVLQTHSIDVRYNVIKKRMEIEVPNMKFIADMKEEASLIEIEDRCINMGIPHAKVRDYLKILAHEYNPVKEWIESQPWDGQSRMQAFMDSLTTQESNQLKEIIMRKWLISCVAAAYEEAGVELEGILVLQGAQGLGKTLWFKRLCDYEKGWLLEGATLNPSDKDSVKRAVSHWIVELGEIESTFKKSDIDQLKAFVTAKTDELRLPYDRAFTTYQRRTAFYASVNAREFLTDTSGNRRFWVLAVKDIDVNHGVDMQQLWAEVKETMYIKGQKNWFLSPDERELLQESNEIYRTQSSVEDLLLEHVDFQSVHPKPVQMTKLLRDLGIKSPRMPDFKEAARVLHERGIEPRRTNGKKVYDISYEPIDDDTGGGGYNFGGAVDD
jgi:putative DNA primase/helicase